MDRELFNILSRHEALTDEELDEKRKEMMGEGWDKLDDEWENMVEFSYNMGQYDEVLAIEELGATTTIVIVVVDRDDVEEPDLEDDKLLESMMRQKNYVGEIARIIKVEESVWLDNAGTNPQDEQAINIAVWT
jgi:hypothetical protein